MQKSQKILKSFVEGSLSSQEFEQELISNIELIEFLSNENLVSDNMNLEGLSSPYYYLIDQNYNNAGARLNAHDICSKILNVINIEFIATTAYDEFYDLIISSQPKYLDIDTLFFENHIYKPEYKTLSKSSQKKEIKKIILRLFQFESKAPKWIQNPQWLIEDNKPLYFLGQYAIKNSNVFHDDGFIYLFIKKDTKEIRTIVQLY
ncbi:hypothetical protein [Maribacter forsetii]|uniref:hypothetical protein n=1 Tax=Maribacter forsetii TaxID=444515 RepID=UPI0005603925|nr:hypothetical protein [Maribacter forsetii]